MVSKITKEKENSIRPNKVSRSGRYIEATGRRKTSVARVRITPASKISISINEKEFKKYFPTSALQKTVLAVFDDLDKKFAVTVKLKGGGISSQSEALRHGLSQALVSFEPSLRTQLKAKGFLKRDPRAKERRKFGLKKARKAPQWSKR